MMGDMNRVCLFRSGIACTYLALVLTVTLFLLSSALAQVIEWTKYPPDPLFGVLGQNVSLEWNFTLTGNDKVYDFKLRQLKDSNQKDIVSYQPGNKAKRVSAQFQGKFDMATNATHPAFVLVNAERKDEAEYCCMVQTISGKDSKNCTNLHILVPPSITGISVNKTRNETDDVTLFCNATGIPSPNVTWSNPGNQVIEYSESVNILLLKNISREQDGDYRCTARNRAGNATASVRVTVNYPATVSPNSTRYNFTEGNNIELSCATDGGPKPTITWTKIGNNVSYSDTQTLTITNANRTDAGVYMCTATNGIGESASATIHVNMFFPPSIHQGSANRTFNETSELELLCNATGNPPPSVTWSKVKDPSVQLVVVDKVLKVKNISRTDSGVYQCRASNGIGSDALASWTVTVNYKPKETRLTSDAYNDAVKETLQVTFSCTADSVPPPELELRFGNSSLGIFVNNIFTLQNVNASNQGTYECVSRNILGTGSTATLNLTVLASLDYISQNTTANETGDVTLFCNSTGNPTPNITWTFLKNSDTVGDSESLFLQQVNRTQAGTYRCTATNGAMNRASADVRLQVNYKPEIQDGPSVIKSWINHKTEVSCEAGGFPAPEIVWTRTGTITTSQTLNSRISTLQFTPKEESEFGILLCVAKNLLGTAKKNITLKQLVAPEAPEILRIDVGSDNMEIHWEASVVDPDSPVLNYLVQVKKKDESQQWMNCTPITLQKSSGTMLCVMTNLKSGMEYIVRVAARNVVGYSYFAVKQSSTEGGKEFKKEEQKGLPGSTIDGIIAGVICFLALIVVIIAVVKKRRSRSRGSNKKNSGEIPEINGSSKKVTVTSYDNPTLESEVSTTGAPQLIFNC